MGDWGSGAFSPRVTETGSISEVPKNPSSGATSPTPAGTQLAWVPCMQTMMAMIAANPVENFIVR